MVVVSVPRTPNRYERQRDVIPPDRIAEVSATVVGVGAIGRPVAMQLAAMGVPRLQLIDPDIVEAINIPTQGYHEVDVGAPKVASTARACMQLNSRIEIETRERRFRRSDIASDMLVSCVDAIETRRFIWQSAGRRASLFLDGRMTAEVVRVLTASDEDSRAHYDATLFDSAQAHRGSCTGRSTGFAGSIAAGLLTAQFTRWLRELPLDADLLLNLLTSELTVLA